MSRNFQLLHQADKERDVFQSGVKPAGQTDSKNNHLDLERLIREQLSRLVQELFLMPNAGSERKMVLFTGVESGNGCTWMCARAAETLAAQVTESVCVVDANLRSPSLHQYFETENLCGFTDVVAKSGPLRDYARRLSGTNLWLVPSGSLGMDLNTLLASDRLWSRMMELRMTFRYVLIDAPPVNLYTDATMLGRWTDGVVLVVEANSTRREAARKAKELLEAAQLRLLGSVLNKRTFPIPEALYRKL
jgi:capsular exopolysaccharide synthesis family protein